MKSPLNIALLAILTAALSGGVLAGCSDDDDSTPDAGTDAGTDAGGDSDTDTDSDADFEIDPERIWDDMVWLADEERGGREPGTEGNEAALDYVTDLLVELGLEEDSEHNFRQAFTFPHWSVTGPAAAAIGDTDLEYSTEYQLFSYTGSGDVTAEMVFVGHGMTVPAFDAADYPSCPLPESGYDDFDGVDVSGKIALVIRHGPDDLESIHDSCPANEACDSSPCLWNFGYKANNAALHGAVGMVLVNHFQVGGDLEAGGTIGAEYYDADFPSLFLDRGVVTAAVTDLETWSGTIDSTLQPASQATGVNATITVSAEFEDVTTENVIAVFEGTDPDLSDEVVFLGAHIDHLGTDFISGDIYYGADDNASGSAVNMELARAMALSGIEPKRTVMIAWWNAEELGLIGSCYYVDNPTVSLSNVIANFSIDMVSGGNGTGLGLSGALAPGNAWIADVMAGASEDAGYDYTVMPGEVTQNSDHACFAAAGVPAVAAMTLGPHPHYHTPQDTPDVNSVEDIASAVYLLWPMLESMALGTEDQYTSKGPGPMSVPYDPRDADAKHWLNRNL